MFMTEAPMFEYQDGDSQRRRCIILFKHCAQLGDIDTLQTFALYKHAALITAYLRPKSVTGMRSKSPSPSAKSTTSAELLRRKSLLKKQAKKPVGSTWRRLFKM